MDRQVEDTTHDTLVLFQARCRGWLGRQKLETLQVQHSAAIVIQQNVLSYLEVREWSWWELFVKVSLTRTWAHEHTHSTPLHSAQTEHEESLNVPDTPLDGDHVRSFITCTQLHVPVPVHVHMLVNGA